MYKRDLTPRYINISDKEFQKKLEWCHDNRPILVEAKYEEIKNTFDDKNEFNRRYPSALCYYFKRGNSKMYLTYKKGEKWYNYDYNAANPEGGDIKPTYTGGDAYRHLQQYAHIPDLTGCYGYTTYHRTGKTDGIMWNIKNLMPAPYVNKKYDYSKDVYVYVYDMHRAFLKACFGLYPDTTEQPKLLARVGENEVGFDEDGIPILEDDGHSHLYVFPLVKNKGIEKWANYMNKKILDLKGKEDKKQELYDAKHEYTDAIGMICRHNPFFHNMISGRCIEYIANLIDENTIRSVTDSIVSLVPRPDLEIGDDMGQFNLEFEGYYIGKQSGYTVEDKNGNILRYKHRGPASSEKLSYLGEPYSRIKDKPIPPLYRKESKFQTIADYEDIDFDLDKYERHISYLTPFSYKKAIDDKRVYKSLLNEKFYIKYDIQNKIEKLEDDKKWYIKEKEQKENPEYYEYNQDKQYIEDTINHCIIKIDEINKKIKSLKEKLQNEEFEEVWLAKKVENGN